jgi:hypothetical protein
MSQTDRSRVAAPSDQLADLHAAGVHRAAVTGIVGAAATLVAGVFVALVVQPRSDVPEDRFSFPWSAAALVPVSVLFAVLHVLVLMGIVGLVSSGLAGTSRPAWVGGWLAVGGTGVLAVAEIASIAVRQQLMDDTGAGLVGALFGLGTVSSMLGFLVLGATTLRSGRWPGWSRFAPLATGLALIALMGLMMTPALAVGVGMYGVLLLGVFLGLARRTGPTRATTAAR